MKIRYKDIVNRPTILVIMQVVRKDLGYRNVWIPEPGKLHIV